MRFFNTEAGASNYPCSETYAGPSASSEDIIKDAIAYLQDKSNNVTVCKRTCAVDLTPF